MSVNEKDLLASILEALADVKAEDPVILDLQELTAMTDYFVAMKIAANEDAVIRRRWLLLSVAVNLGFLFYFKYLFFVVDNGVAVCRVGHRLEGQGQAVRIRVVGEDSDTDRGILGRVGNIVHRSRRQIRDGDAHRK